MADGGSSGEGSGLISVVIADDHELFADALALTLTASGRFEVVGRAGSGDALVALWTETRPDLVVTDISMGEVNGIAATQAIRAMEPEARVVLISAFHDKHLVRKAVAAGAVGLISKASSGAEIVNRLIVAANGGTSFASGPDGVERGDAQGSVAGAPVLSSRQLEMIRGLAAGKSIREIAAEHFIAISTVKTHLTGAYQRLGVSTSAGAIAAAAKLGLLDSAQSG